MAKKRYNVFLDEDAVEFVRPFLEKKGLSFSGFLDEAVKEYAAAIKSMNFPDDISKLTLADFVGMLSRMMKGMKGKDPVDKPDKS